MVNNRHTSAIVTIASMMAGLVSSITQDVERPCVEFACGKCDRKVYADVLTPEDFAEADRPGVIHAIKTDNVMLVQCRKCGSRAAIVVKPTQQNTQVTSLIRRPSPVGSLTANTPMVTGPSGGNRKQRRAAEAKGRK